jgi:hypothetical protein
LTLARREFDRYLQTHEMQTRLARLLEKEISHLNPQRKPDQDDTAATAMPTSSQELLEKTTDLMSSVRVCAAQTLVKKVNLHLSLFF